MKTITRYLSASISESEEENSFLFSFLLLLFSGMHIDPFKQSRGAFSF